MTEWRPIAGYEGRYSVSDDGRVMVHAAAGRGRLNEDRIMKPGVTTTGYAQVILYGVGKPSPRRIHRLVLEAFVGPMPSGSYALHNDGDKANNRLENLRWGNSSENALDMVRHGVHNHARKTHCKWGHELSGANLIRTARQRACRECARRRNREYEARHALAVYAADQINNQINAAAEPAPF